MTSLSTSTNHYTDSPGLHPNLFLGSLQLVAWIFFHPSAWRNYAASFEPPLPPDFCLIDLQPSHWRDPRMRRFLIQRYAIWPVWTGLLSLGVLSCLGVSGNIILMALTFGVASDLACGALAGMSVGVITGGISVGLMSGIGEGLIIQMTGSLAFSTEVVQVPHDLPGMVFSVVTGLGAGWSGAVAVNAVQHRRSDYSFARQIGSVVVGIIVSGIVLLEASVVAGLIAIAYSLLAGTKMDDDAFQLVTTLVFGVTLGTAFGLIITWRARRWHWGILLYILVFAAFSYLRGLAATIDPSGIPIDVLREFAAGLSIGTLFCSLFALAYLIGEKIAGPIAGVVAASIGSGCTYLALVSLLDFELGSARWLFLFLCLTCTVAGLTVSWWRPILFYPFLLAWNLLLYSADERQLPLGRPSLLRWNSAFWDEHQTLQLSGLEDHLLLVLEQRPAEGYLALDHLALDPHQRWAAQACQIELEARRLEGCPDIQAISNAYRHLSAGELEGPVSALLRSFSRISQDVEAALRQESSYNQRLVMNAVEDRLDGLLRELTRSNERYTARFRPIAVRWRQLVSSHIGYLVTATELKQEIDNPYVIGVPLTEQQEIFVGRADVSAHIERLMLNRDSSPVLLYGQRRMGKTSLLNNLGRLLPSNITPFFVDLQGPVILSNNESDIFYGIARSMIVSARQQRRLNLPTLSGQALTSNPFMRFDEWLDEVEKVMEAQGQSIALLSLDEFEMLDNALVTGHFSATSVLGMLRHLIQHRPRFKVLLAASHTMDELQRWSSYLINAQVVALRHLSQDEAQQLIEHPTKNFTLRYEPEASQRVLALTCQHPFLIQLMCSEIVTLKNEQATHLRRLAQPADVELAAHSALRRGSFFFADIQRNQTDENGVAVLRTLATHGEAALVDKATLQRLSGITVEIEPVLTGLIQRGIIETVESGYRFQVELIRRWFLEHDSPSA